MAEERQDKIFQAVLQYPPGHKVGQETKFVRAKTPKEAEDKVKEQLQLSFKEADKEMVKQAKALRGVHIDKDDLPSSIFIKAADNVIE